MASREFKSAVKKVVLHTEAGGWGPKHLPHYVGRGSLGGLLEDGFDRV